MKDADRIVFFIFCDINHQLVENLYVFIRIFAFRPHDPPVAMLDHNSNRTRNRRMGSGAGADLSVNCRAADSPSDGATPFIASPSFGALEGVAILIIKNGYTGRLFVAKLLDRIAPFLLSMIG